MITRFNCQKHFFCKLFSFVKQFKFKQFNWAKDIKTVLFQAILISINKNFKCKNSKLSKPWLSSIWPFDRTLFRCYHFGPEWIWERWQWRGTLHSPKLQHNRNLTIKLFSDISRTFLGGGVIIICESAVDVFYSCYLITEWFFYVNHFSLIIFYHSVWLGFERFGS